MLNKLELIREASSEDEIIFTILVIASDFLNYQSLEVLKNYMRSKKWNETLFQIVVLNIDGEYKDYINKVVTGDGLSLLKMILVESDGAENVLLLSLLSLRVRMPGAETLPPQSSLQRRLAEILNLHS